VKMGDQVRIRIENIGSFKGRNIGEACQKLDNFLKEKMRSSIKIQMEQERKHQAKIYWQKKQDSDWTIKRINRRRK